MVDILQIKQVINIVICYKILKNKQPYCQRTQLNVKTEEYVFAS